MSEYTAVLTEYSKSYDIEGISNPNDKANLDMLIRTHILIRAFQKEQDDLLHDPIGNIDEITKIQKTLQGLIEQSVTLERTLGIDRKSRKKDTGESVSAYLDMIRTEALEFLEKHFIYVYCPSCKIMCGRIIPAHEHTKFDVGFQCSQCKKIVKASRKEKDVFFDIKGDNSWRKKYPVEIIQPKEDDSEVIGDEEV